MKNLAKFTLAALLGLTTLGSHALTIGITEGVTYRAADSEIEAKFEGIAKALSTATRQPVNMKVISSYNGLREALKSGQVDLAFIHPSHVAYESVKAGTYRTVAWTAGFTEYKVALLCKESPPVQNWSAMVGKSFVTPDPDSITAAMMRATLTEHRIKHTDVKLQTTRYQDAIPFYVENNFAVYGATASGAVIKAWKEKGGKTCGESRPMPIKQWIVSNKLDADTANTLRDSLLGLSQSDAGKKALAPSGYKGFVAPSSDLEKQLIVWLGV